MKVFSPQVWGSHLGQEKAVVKNHSSALLQTKYSDTSRCQKSTNDGLMSIINQSAFLIWNKATIEILQQSIGNLSCILIPTILINLLCFNKSHSQIINRTHWEFCLCVTILRKGGLLTQGAGGGTPVYGLHTVNSRYSGHPRDRNVVSVIARVRNSGVPENFYFKPYLRMGITCVFIFINSVTFFRPVVASKEHQNFIYKQNRT